MGRIFISYRREDSAGHTGRLFDRLSEHFGKDHVFMDIADIEPGVDFVEAINRALDSCDVFVVVIGRQWLNVTDATERRRIDDPEDFIRLEIANALRKKIGVIPVLVQGATMPGAANLPDDLKSLSRRQGHELSENRWDYDMERLIKVLEKVLGPGKRSRGKKQHRTWLRWPAAIAILITFGYIGLGVGAMIEHATRNGPAGIVGFGFTSLIGLVVAYRVWKRFGRKTGLQSVPSPSR
jgi:TIR domain